MLKKFVTKSPASPLSAVLTLILAVLSGNAVAGQKNPYVMADDTLITLNGAIKSVSRDSFVLDYGQGEIIVEMDDGDRDADGYKLLPGDQVAVSGRIDDDFFETTTIEAASVFVKNLGTTFFASSLDEEDRASYSTVITNPLPNHYYSLIGTVTEVNDDEFTLNTGERQVRVEVDELGYDPLDDEGYQKVEVGDRVSVSGEVEYDLFKGREVAAESIVIIDYSGS